MQYQFTFPTAPTQNDTRTIPLTQGQVAVVDASDYADLAQYKWFARRHGPIWYADRGGRTPDGQWRHIQMHRVLLAAPPSMEVDHIDGDGLNNTRANLRLATRTQNSRNRRLHADNTSGYKGVVWQKDRGKWKARIGANGKMIFLGYFVTREEAAVVYDAAAQALHGEFARTNAMLGDDAQAET